jgi:predicted amidohydrolase YtcJ
MRNPIIAVLSLAGLLSLAGCRDAPGPATADALFVNANVLTMNDAAPRAEAVAVQDGHILAVGTADTVDAHRGPETVVHDLAGQTLLPGFVDAHGHLSFVGLMAQAADLFPPPDGGVTSIAELQDALRHWLETSDLPGRRGYVFGVGYDDSQLAEQRHPTRDELDAVSSEIPIYVLHQSAHLGAANSAALERLGISAETPDPEGGVIRRRPGSAEPDGVLEENANMLALSGLVLQGLTPADALESIVAGQERYASFGFTTAQDGGTTPETAAGYIAAAEAGALELDVVSYVFAPAIREDDPFLFSPYAGRAYVDHYRIGGMKLMLDGSPQGKTAWLTEPYHRPPEGLPADYRGYPNMPDDRVRRYLTRAFEHGWQVLAHTNGDAAIDQFLDALADVSARLPGDDRRPVAIHAQTTRADQLERMDELGVIPSFFAAHTFYWGDWHRDSVLGPERAPDISPTGWAAKRGMRFTTHHDAPIIPPDAMRILWATVNRVTRSGQVLGPHQRVDVATALKAMTLWPAWQHFEEVRKGSIEPGKLADLVVLSADPLAVDPLNIADIEVLRTIKAGKEIFRRTEP